MRFVLRTDPIHLATKVPLDAEIQVYFMIDLQSACVKSENIILFNLDTQASEPISLEYKNKVLLIKPVQGLQPLQHYQIELVGGKNGLIDITDGTLDSSYIFEFYSNDVTKVQPPRLIHPTPFASIPDLLFQWEEAENAYFYELELSKSNTFNVLSWPLEPTRIYETSVTPAASLETGVQYYARIRTVNREGVESAYSEPIQFIYEPITLQGTGALDGTSGEDTSDQLGSLQDALGTGNDDSQFLHIIKTTPEHLQVNVPTSFDVVTKPVQEVSMEFDEELDPNSIDSTLFYLIAQKN